MCSRCLSLRWQVQAANAERTEEREKELMWTEVLLLAALVLAPLWNPGLPSVKALYLILWITSRQNAFAGGKWSIFACAFHFWILYVCPIATTSPIMALQNTNLYTKIYFEFNQLWFKLIRSYLCPGKHPESWSPLDCWFQSCSRGQWPAASASAAKRGLWEKQMTDRVNLTDGIHYEGI